MKKIFYPLVSLTLLGNIVIFANRAEAELPPHISNALTTSEDWLFSLKGKSQEEILKLFGEPLERITWDVQARKDPVFKYQLKTKNQTLIIYFLKGSVLTLSLQIIPTSEGGNAN